MLEQRLRDAGSLEDAAVVLGHLLSGGYSVWSDGSLYSIRQLVERLRGLRIEVHANEHAPPHFHVTGPDVDATFAIADCAYLQGNIDGREERLVRWWFERSRPLVIAAWNATRPSNCPVGPFVE